MADEPVQFARLAALPNYPSVPCIIKTEKKSDRKIIGKEILEKVRSNNMTDITSSAHSVCLCYSASNTLFFLPGPSSSVLLGRCCKRFISVLSCFCFLGISMPSTSHVILSHYILSHYISSHLTVLLCLALIRSHSKLLPYPEHVSIITVTIHPVSVTALH